MINRNRESSLGKLKAGRSRKANKHKLNYKRKSEVFGLTETIKGVFVPAWQQFSPNTSNVKLKSKH